MKTDVRSALRLQLGMLRDLGPVGALRFDIAMARHAAASRAALRGGRYTVHSDEQIRATKSAAVAFVFGSGYSLNALTAEEWRHVASGHTIGFNTFVRQQWVRVDYHIVRGWGIGADPTMLANSVADFGSLVARNPQYARTVFVFQDDFTALFAHALISRRGLPPGSRVFPYRTKASSASPGRTFDEGLVHATGTLCDAINFAVCMRFAKIVLVGVDLYDSRYFWAEPGMTVAVDLANGTVRAQQTSNRGKQVDQQHHTAANGIVPLLESWYTQLRADGIELQVYNHRSLLAQVMPVYSRPATADAAALEAESRTAR